MRSASDHEDERRRMEALRKEANLTSAIASAGKAAKTVQSIGKGAWNTAKTVGGGTTMGGLGVLAGTTYLGSQVPGMVRKTKQKKNEAMQPWQGVPTRI